jgi:TrmH family RNA methyltransferase
VLAARKLLKRSERQAVGRFLVEGPLPVTEALAADAVIELFVDRDAPSAGEVVRRGKRKGVPVHAVTSGVIAALSDTETPQGIVAVAAAPVADESVLGDPDVVVVLAQVRDPGNAGTLIRSAVAAGAGAIVFTKGSVDPLNAKTVRASAGALFNIPVVVDVTLEDAVARMRAAGLRIVGADAGADRPPEEVDLRSPFALVVGNESWGLPEASRELLDEVIGIPMPGPAESLNAAIAGSILLFEAVRQRRSRT